MRALGLIVEYTKLKRCEQLPAGGVRLGCNSKVFLAEESVAESLRTFVQILQNAKLPAPQDLTDLFAHDSSFDEVLTNICGMGLHSDYVRPHVRRKRMFMLYKKLCARNLWAQTTIDHLKSMVLDSSDG
jgi:DNA-binding GntR family transcriptional regulator